MPDERNGGMSIMTKPPTPEYDKGFEDTFKVEVSTDCPICRRHIKIKVSKRAFEAHENIVYTCPICGCESTF